MKSIQTEVSVRVKLETDPGSDSDSAQATVRRMGFYTCDTYGFMIHTSDTVRAPPSGV